MQFAIEAISAISGEAASPAGSVSATSTAVQGFDKLMSESIERVNTDIASAEAGMMALARGEPVELHQVMISMEKARISAMALVQIRNRLVEAYQEVTRMQV